MGPIVSTDYFDSEPLGTQQLRFQVAITVEGDEIHLDFSGNPPQVRAGLNMVWTALLATCYYAVKIVVDPTILPNAGMYRPIHVDAEPDSILNCSEPAAINGRTQTCQRVVDLILGALFQAVPERVIAACTGSNSGITFSGVDPRSGQYYSYLETIGGGFGARATKDGLDGVQTHVTNTSNLPVESLEQEYPILVERYELASGTGGSGRHRGGMAIRRSVRVVGHQAAFGGSTSRRLSSPWGLDSGFPGARALIVLDRPDGSHFEDTQIPTLLESGDVITIQTAGSGGYGPASERPSEQVRRDVDDGVITVAQAREDYGFRD